LKWDKDVQKVNGVKAQWKYLLAGERRSMNNRARLRGEDMKTRKRLGEEAVERSRVEEEGLKRYLRQERGNEVGKDKIKAKERMIDDEGDAMLMFTGAWNSFAWE
jgi:hypothetical protein